MSGNIVFVSTPSMKDVFYIIMESPLRLYRVAPDYIEEDDKRKDGRCKRILLALYKHTRLYIGHDENNSDNLYSSSQPSKETIICSGGKDVYKVLKKVMLINPAEIVLCRCEALGRKENKELIYDAVTEAFLNVLPFELPNIKCDVLKNALIQGGYIPFENTPKVQKNVEPCMDGEHEVALLLTKKAEAVIRQGRYKNASNILGTIQFLCASTSVDIKLSLLYYSMCDYSRAISTLEGICFGSFDMLPTLDRLHTLFLLNECYYLIGESDLAKETLERAEEISGQGRYSWQEYHQACLLYLKIVHNVRDADYKSAIANAEHAMSICKDNNKAELDFIWAVANNIKLVLNKYRKILDESLSSLEVPFIPVQDIHTRFHVGFLDNEKLGKLSKFGLGFSSKVCLYYFGAGDFLHFYKKRSIGDNQFIKSIWCNTNALRESYSRSKSRQYIWEELESLKSAYQVYETEGNINFQGQCLYQMARCASILKHTNPSMEKCEIQWLERAYSFFYDAGNRMMMIACSSRLGHPLPSSPGFLNYLEKLM